LSTTWRYRRAAKAGLPSGSSQSCWRSPSTRTWRSKATGQAGYAEDEYLFRSPHPHLRRCFDAFGPEWMWWGTDTRMPCSWRQCITLFTKELPGFKDRDLEELWHRVPHYKPLRVGVVLLDLVPAAQHQPDLFAADTGRRQKLSPLIDCINDRYGRCAIGFGLFPPGVRAFKGDAAFHRVPERWEF
jgi:hypothetical protein